MKQPQNWRTRLSVWGRRLVPASVRLRRGLRRAHAEYQTRIAEARRCGSPKAEILKLESDYHFAVREYEDEIQQISTDYWLKKARRYRVPVQRPKRDDDGWIAAADEYWYEGYDYTALLTTAGIHKIRGLIREERRWRRDTWFAWLAVLTGIIGALTGLVSVWSKK